MNFFLILCTLIVSNTTFATKKLDANDKACNVVVPKAELKNIEAQLEAEAEAANQKIIHAQFLAQAEAQLLSNTGIANNNITNPSVKPDPTKKPHSTSKKFDSRPQPFILDLKKMSSNNKASIALMSLLMKVTTNPRGNPTNIENNTQYLAEAYKQLQHSPHLKLKFFKYFRTKLIGVLAKNYKIRRDINKKHGDPLFLIDSPVIAQQYSVVDLVTHLDMLIAKKEKNYVNAHQTMSQKEAYQTLLIANNYSFSKYFGKWPSILEIVYPVIFKNYQPTKNSKNEEIIQVYAALSKMHIKVPESWHKVSLNWLIENMRNGPSKIPVRSLAKIYKGMLDTGVPPRIEIENFIYSQLLDTNTSLSNSAIENTLESMARAMITPSTHLTKSSIEPHFVRLQEVIENFPDMLSNSFQLKFFYMNAIYRLGFFKIDSLTIEYRYELKESNSVKLVSKASEALKRIFPKAKFSARTKIATSLPSVNFYEPSNKLAFVVGRPWYDTLVVRETDQLTLIEVLKNNDAIRVSTDLYRYLGFNYFVIDYSVFQKSTQELIDQALIKNLRGQENL